MTGICPAKVDPVGTGSTGIELTDTGAAGVDPAESDSADTDQRDSDLTDTGPTDTGPTGRLLLPSCCCHVAVAVFLLQGCYSHAAAALPPQCSAAAAMLLPS